MAAKFSPSELTSGMAMGVEFLSRFQKAIIEAGGSPLLIWFMSLPKSADKLLELARFAVSQHFPIPISIFSNLAMVRSRQEWDGEGWQSDMFFCWELVINFEAEFGIDRKYFSDIQSNEAEPVPGEIKQQIFGKPLVYPLTVHYGGEEYLVVSLSQEGDRNPVIGEVWSEVDEPIGVSIASLKYFDLDN